jgi:YVTN family beta-propeller protein
MRRGAATRRRMRWALTGLLTLVVALLAGCASAATATQPTPAPLPTVTLPAPLAAYHVYISDLSTGDVILLGASTRRVSRSVHGLGLSADGRTLLVTDVGRNRVLGLAPNGSNAGEPRAAPVGTQPVHVAATPDGRILFVTNFGGASVSVVDAATWTTRKEIAVPDRPHAIVLSPGGRYAYVSCYGGAAIAVLDTAAEDLAATLPLPAPSAPYGLALSADGRYLYTSDNLNGKLLVLDTADRQVVASVPVGAKPALIARAPDGARLYVANGLSHSVTVLDTSRDAAHPVPLREVPVDGYPHGLAVTPDGRYVVVANTISGNLSVIDATTDLVVATIASPVLQYPNDVLITG